VGLQNSVIRPLKVVHLFYVNTDNGCLIFSRSEKKHSLKLDVQATADSDTQEPLDELTSTSAAWFQSLGVDVSTVSDVLSSEDELISQGIQDGITRANQRAISRAQNIQKWRILPRDFSIVNGELGLLPPLLMAVC